MAADNIGKLSMAGKVAVVTGGTQGLGETIAHLFADRGAGAVVICGRNKDNGARVRSAIEAKGSKCLYVQADLEHVDDCRKVIGETDATFGRLDALVNAAPITDRGTIWDTSPRL